jgi:hypothetical protein
LDDKGKPFRYSVAPHPLSPRKINIKENCSVKFKQATIFLALTENCSSIYGSTLHGCIKYLRLDAIYATQKKTPSSESV